jgi:outer membrane protein assembly factor BamA
MSFIFRIFFFTVFVFLFGCIAKSQIIKDETLKDIDITKKKPQINIDNTFIKITNINITGNKKTKGYIIEREMSFKIGDYLPKDALAKNFKQSKTQVYNTNLFIEVKVDSTILSDSTLQVNVAVKERWYIFPTPQFSLVDRSYKEWINTFNADLNRVVYGIDFTHYNFSGRRDQLSISGITGYARKIAFSYSSPYSNNKLTEGFSISGSYTQNKEIGYNTSDTNSPVVYPKITDTILKIRQKFVRDNYQFDAAYSWRKGFFKRTGVSIGLNYLIVDDSIVNPIYNPQYFNTGKSKQFYTDINFAVVYANTDKNAYPLKGTIYNYGISKRGFGFSGGINATSLSGFFAKYISHKHNFYSSIKSAALLKIPFEQAYINRRAIGFGSLKLRGLELFIVDGVAAFTSNYTFSKKLFAFKIPIPFKIKAVPYIPFTFYAKTFADIGYSYIPKKYDTRLNNRFLYTGGFGLDILSLYDLVFKIEYSFNQLGQKGVFLQGGGGN